MNRQNEYPEMQWADAICERPFSQYRPRKPHLWWECLAKTDEKFDPVNSSTPWINNAHSGSLSLSRAPPRNFANRYYLCSRERAAVRHGPRCELSSRAGKLTPGPRTDRVNVVSYYSVRYETVTTRLLRGRSILRLEYSFRCGTVMQ